MKRAYIAAVIILLVAAGSCQPGAPQRPVATAEHLRLDSPDMINLVAVQMSVDLTTYRDAGTFADEVEDIMQRADSKVGLGPDSLVVFPENAGTLTVMCGHYDSLTEAETLQEGIEGVVMGNLMSVLYQKLSRRSSWARALFLARQGDIASTYFETFSQAADSHDVFLLGGTVTLTDSQLARFVPEGVAGSPDADRAADDRNVYNVSVLFGPQGEVLGAARKVHLIELEGPEGLDLQPGQLDDLQPIETPLGTLGVAICLDAFRGDVLEHLQAGGADILLQPSANPVQWEPWQQEEWLMSSAEAVSSGQFTYAVNPMLTGQLLDLGFYGQSGIFAAGIKDCDYLGDLGRPPGYIDVPHEEAFLRAASDPAAEEIIHVRVPHPDLVGQ